MRKNIDITRLNLGESPHVKKQVTVLPFVFIGLIFVTFIGLGTRGVELQVNASSAYYDSSLNLSTFKKYIPAQRGLFLDRNQSILAKNYTDYSLYLYKKAYTVAEVTKARELLSSVLDESSINTLFDSLAKSEYDVKVDDNLSYNVLDLIRSDPQFDYFFYLINSQKRVYLYPEEFSHLIGYTGKTEAADVLQGYSQFDQIGKYKLESEFESELKGIKGASYYMDGTQNYIPSEPGNNIELTIDKDWQVALYKIIQKYSNEYDSAGGAGVIVDDSNGQVMSIISYPGINTNLFITGISSDQYKSYEDDRKLPLIDKSIALQVAPGSTFKIITAYALLENSIVDSNTTFYSNRCLQEQNFDFCEYHQYFYGQMDIVRALYKSSNLFFCTNSLELERQGKLDKLFEAEKLFGLGQDTGINIPGELPGNIDTPEYKKENFDLNWYSGDTCNAVIGQGSNTVTPMQMALVAQAIANKGVVYKPNVISKITDSFGNVLEVPQAEVLRTIPISESAVNLINEGMSDVANYWDGTVYPFLGGLPGNLRVKTGTAEASEVRKDGSINNTTHGWIVGSFDYNGKTYSFAHVLNLGGGGYYVGQIMRDFINCLYSGFPGECK